MINQKFLEKLSDRNPEERINAILRLQAYYGAEAVESICTMLNDLDYGVRTQAIGALIQLADGRAVEPLITALDVTRRKLRNFADRKNLGMPVDGVQEVKEAVFMSGVINALGRIGDLRAEAVLGAVVKESLWGDDDEEAARALEAIRKRAGHGKK